jgi:hypothetical protein
LRCTQAVVAADALGSKPRAAAARALRARSPTATWSSSRRRRAMNTTTRAAVDVSVAYAVAQQDLFFAACVAGETLYQQGNMPSDFKGRPTFQSIALPCGLLVGAFLAIQTDNAVVSPGG